ASQVVRCAVIHAGPEPHARGVQVWLADISGKVCQGHTFTVGLYASGGSPCRSSTKRYILRAYLPLIAPFRSMLLTARGGSCSLAPKVHEVPVCLMAFLHSYIPLARHAAQLGVGATTKQGRAHHPNDFSQELVLAAQTPFDLGYQVFREAQILESLLQDLGSVLRLAAVTLKALLCFEAATLPGFRVCFDRSWGGGHGALLVVCVSVVVAVCQSSRDTYFLASVSMASPRRHGLLRPSCFLLSPRGGIQSPTVFSHVFAS